MCAVVMEIIVGGFKKRWKCKVWKEGRQIMVIRLIFKMETEELTALSREILFICVVGLILAQGKPVILEGEFTFKLLELKRFLKLCADGPSSPSLE